MMEGAHNPDDPDALEKRVRGELDATDSYAATKGDVMLALSIELSNPDTVVLA